MNDFDSDGWLDVFLTNGVPREMNHSDINITREMLVGKHIWEFFKAGEMRKEQNLAYQNRGGLEFEDVSSQWGLDHVGASYGAATADLDNDGDLDLVVVNLEENVSVYRNNGGDGSYVTIELQGTSSNRYGIGAVVCVEAEGKSWIRQLMPSVGYHSYDEPILHFGLGDVARIDRVEISWPGGDAQMHEDVPINQRIKFTQKSGTRASSPPEKAWFKRKPLLKNLWHQENEFNDFRLQPLLPHELSSEGPCMAWSDVNRDGFQDVFIGGSSASCAQLYLGTASGGFRSANQEAFLEDCKGEDSAAQFGDFDHDGDMDLLVGRGSYEFREGQAELVNILYFNDGTGRFSKVSADQLPESAVNSGTLAVADFDRDGDLDAFVGTRVMHGEYPRSAPSELWINQEGSLLNKSDELADELRQTGMVTDAVWADVNGDDWLDLLVAREWETIALYVNQEGRLEMQTETGELSDRKGWWKSIDAGDIDGDGDIDLLAANIGLNTKYKTSTRKPMTLYYGEFDETEKRHIVEVKREGESCYPERGRSCSSNAMPFIADKYETFHEFGLASLSDIYGENKLEAADRFEADTFEHGIFVNDGQGKFDFHALARIAQIAPSSSARLADLDNDNDLDMVLGQNFFGPQSETGRYDGGLGQILINDGTGNFEEVAPATSGFAVRQAATAVEVLDINRDGRLDIVVATNNGPTEVFINQIEEK